MAKFFWPIGDLIIGVPLYTQTLDCAIHQLKLITIQQINIREPNCLIHWIEIYTVDSVIQPLNNWGQASCSKGT